MRQVVAAAASGRPRRRGCGLLAGAQSRAVSSCEFRLPDAAGRMSAPSRAFRHPARPPSPSGGGHRLRPSGRRLAGRHQLAHPDQGAVDAAVVLQGGEVPRAYRRADRVELRACVARLLTASFGLGSGGGRCVGPAAEHPVGPRETHGIPADDDHLDGAIGRGQRRPQRGVLLPPRAERALRLVVLLDEDERRPLGVASCETQSAGGVLRGSSRTFGKTPGRGRSRRRGGCSGSGSTIRSSCTRRRRWAFRHGRGGRERALPQ